MIFISGVNGDKKLFDFQKLKIDIYLIINWLLVKELSQFLEAYNPFL